MRGVTAVASSVVASSRSPTQRISADGAFAYLPASQSVGANSSLSDTSSPCLAALEAVAWLQRPKRVSLAASNRATAPSASRYPHRPPVVDVERTVGAGDRRVAQDAAAPLPDGRRVVEFARRLDVDPFELFVGVEPQVEEMRQRPQQFRLPDLVPRHVVEGERRAVSGCRREAGAQPAPAADREVHPLLGAVETDLPEVFRRGRRHALGRGAHGDLHLGPARFADIPVVERPVLRVGDVDAGDVAVETCVDERRPLRRGEERRTGREVRQRRLRAVRRAAQRPSVALRVVEDDDPVLEGGAQRLPLVFEAVRQLEPHVRVFAQPHRVEARQARPRTDAVVGRVTEFVFEPHAHLRQRPEAEFALLDAQAASGAVCVGERGPRLVDLLRREGVDEVAHGVVRHEGVGLHPSQRIGRRRAVGLAPCQKPHLLLPDAGVVRGVGAAHVERAEPRALHEGAFDGVPRFGEECLHQCADRQEGVVVVGREQPLGRSEPRVAVLDFVAVAVYRQEFYGRVVAPPRGDLGRQQPSFVGYLQLPEPPLRRLLGPCVRPPRSSTR